MLMWIWIGGGVMVFGTLIALSTPRRTTPHRPARDEEDEAAEVAIA